MSQHQNAPGAKDTGPALQVPEPGSQSSSSLSSESFPSLAVVHAGSRQANSRPQTYRSALGGGSENVRPGSGPSVQGVNPGASRQVSHSQRGPPHGPRNSALRSFSSNSGSRRQGGRQHNHNDSKTRSLQGAKPGAAPQHRHASSARSRQPVAHDLSVHSSVRLVLRGLSSEETTWSLWSNFESLGNVVFIELDEIDARSISRPRCARVVFEPPPTDTEKLSRRSFRLTKSKGQPVVEMHIALDRRDWASVQTPLQRTCPTLAQMAAKKITFGMLTGPTTVMNKLTLEASDLEQDADQNLTVNYKAKKLTVNFTLVAKKKAGTEVPARTKMRADIRFAMLTGNKMFRVKLPGQRWALVMALDEPPVWWRKRDDPKVSHHDQRLAWSDMELWVRAVEVAPQQDVVKRDWPYSLDLEDQYIDPGRWITFWIEFDQSQVPKWLTLESFLRDWNMPVDRESPFQLVEDAKAPLWGFLDEPRQNDTSSGQSDLATLFDHVILPFDVRYQLEVCISHGIFSEYNLTVEFVTGLYKLTKKTDGSPWDRARLVLEYAADEGHRIFDPMSLFNNQAALGYQSAAHHMPSYCALVRKVVVTPTRVYFNTPTVETTNRVIRKYRSVQDDFLRIQFTDEISKGRIDGCDVDRDNEIYARTFRFLRNGIRMGHWEWQFLAFGNSQIRENGAYLYCQRSDDRITCDSIRAWMGDFSHIKVVAKYAARLGQCFSTTRQIRGLHSPQVVDIADVERNGFCFTDGVGKVSNFVASMVSSDFKLAYVPSVFQFRMGGSKGVLVQWPDVKRDEVHIRGSQTKFNAQSSGLEIIRTSAFSSATLNRQTITILSTLKVRDGVFTAMTEEQLASYNMAMTNKEKAIKLLGQFVDENSMTITMRQMVRDGFMETKEPFVQSLLQLWKTWSIKALKEKARLVVEKGAFVLGCVDETCTLRGHSKETEGRRDLGQHELPQIFLQIPDQETGVYKVITGLCLVGRNPSLHPGDIRVVEAVDVAALRHIRDAVVFPMLGDRDIPSMCSGGDLDGDDFFVFWEPALMPPQQEWGNVPMDYQSTPPPEEEAGVQVDDLVKFFTLYMKNNSLPLIAHAHLAMADKQPEGAKHEMCLELASLHSKAVDYVKTGQPAIFDRKRHQPPKWPHWMEKKNSYESKKALGLVFDLVGTQNFDPSYDMPFDKRILCSHADMDAQVLQKARKLKSQYDTAMHRLMGQMEIGTEFEAWSTFVLSKPRVGTGYKLQETLGRESSALKQQFRELCKEAVESQEREVLFCFVAAMYRVTWEEVQIAVREAKEPVVRSDGSVVQRRVKAECMPLISFPWLFDSLLGRIALAYDASDEPREELDPEKIQYTRVRDGVVLHRDEYVKLFHDDDEETLWDAVQPAADTGPSPPPEPLHAVASDDNSTASGSQVVDATPSESPSKPSSHSEPLSSSGPESPSRHVASEEEEADIEEDLVEAPEGPSAMDRLAKLLLDDGADDDHGHDGLVS